MADLMNKLTCPSTLCRTDNDPRAEACSRCGSPLRGYARLVTHPAQLFNQGLAAAREGQLTRARDLFAAVVHWCPLDLEARNALALACLVLGDQAEARVHWGVVLARAPTDTLAKQGTAVLDGAAPSAPRPERNPPPPRKSRASKSKTRSSKRR